MVSLGTQHHAAVYDAVKTLYVESGDLPFHGWHHIVFVHSKSALFATDLQADPILTQIAALVHDLNYLAQKGVFTPPAAGQSLRHAILSKCGVTADRIAHIEDIVVTAETGKGGDHLSPEAKALSDADILFKALPTTPILFASRYIAQTDSNIRKLADMIIANQKPLVDADTYFYSETARAQYMHWARTNVDLWQGVIESFDDPDVITLLQQAGFKCDLL